MVKRATAILCVLAAIGGAVLWSYHRGPTPSELHGLWFERDCQAPTDEMRFYYFHPGGKGLYRYGQVAYNQTHSFDWSIAGDQLTLVFRKRGERAATRFQLGEDGGRRTLTLLHDPRGEGRVRYRHAPANLDVTGLLALPGGEVGAAGEGEAIGGRMWIDLRRYATGGIGFSMYQLSEHPASSGWRVGWHHAGDFDDWTTELLSYRTEPGALTAFFVLRRETATTPTALAGQGGARTLTLARDPRNFLARSRFVDGGKSF